MSTAQRADLPGVSTPRAHQILAGAIVAYETMHALNVAEVTVCRWALREGLILHHFTATEPEGLLPFQPLQPAPRADRGEETTASALWTAAAG
ncbi:hypothetical protein A5767_07675 [Rhodococcus sp. 852002-51564_SCH6189132-a]|nr:hypothetical protein A5767_07675 [Rhodococcus sp. 852002-51564_SCH6189132-a]